MGSSPCVGTGALGSRAVASTPGMFVKRLDNGVGCQNRAHRQLTVFVAGSMLLVEGSAWSGSPYYSACGGFWGVSSPSASCPSSHLWPAHRCGSAVGLLDASDLGPFTYKQDKEEAPGSLFQPGPASPGCCSPLGDEPIDGIFPLSLSLLFSL